MDKRMPNPKLSPSWERATILSRASNGTAYKINRQKELPFGGFNGFERKIFSIKFKLEAGHQFYRAFCHRKKY
jgi:hypothetical protein